MLIERFSSRSGLCRFNDANSLPTSALCLVPASDFYDWQEFAGLWERWTARGVIETFIIVTTDANEQLAKFHDRMPVILDRQDWEAWLDPAAKQNTLEALIRPYPADEIQAWPVSTKVTGLRKIRPS